MQFLQYFFWLSIAIVFYTYIGYGIILFILVRIKEKIHPPSPLKRRWKIAITSTIPKKNYI